MMCVVTVEHKVIQLSIFLIGKTVVYHESDI